MRVFIRFKDASASDLASLVFFLPSDPVPDPSKFYEVDCKGRASPGETMLGEGGGGEQEGEGEGGGGGGAR